MRWVSGKGERVMKKRKKINKREKEWEKWSKKKKNDAREKISWIWEKGKIGKEKEKYYRGKTIKKWKEKSTSRKIEVVLKK